MSQAVIHILVLEIVHDTLTNLIQEPTQFGQEKDQAAEYERCRRFFNMVAAMHAEAHGRLNPKYPHEGLSNNHATKYKQCQRYLLMLGALYDTDVAKQGS